MTVTMSDSPEFDQFSSSQPARKRISFDPTINLGHVLTMVTFVGLGVSTYYSLDKRLTKQEDMAPFVASAREEKDRDMKARMDGLATDLKEVKISVDKLGLSVQVQNAVNSATGKK